MAALRMGRQRPTKCGSPVGSVSLGTLETSRLADRDARPSVTPTLAGRRGVLRQRGVGCVGEAANICRLNTGQAGAHAYDGTKDRAGERGRPHATAQAAWYARRKRLVELRVVLRATGLIPW